MRAARLNRKANSLQGRRNQLLLERVAVALARSVKNAKNDFIEDCAVAFEAHRERDFHGQLIAHRVVVTGLLRQQATIVIPPFCRHTLNDLRDVQQRADNGSLFEQLIARWAADRARADATQISGTTLADVTTAVEAGITAREGSAAIASRIRSVSTLSPYRSLTVARTETLMAATFAQAETASQAEDDLGIKLVKTWLPTLDDRTREAHADMADYPAIPLDEKFIVGGVPMDRPGDPAGGAANLVNCRCTLFHSAADGS